MAQTAAAAGNFGLNAECSLKFGKLKWLKWKLRNGNYCPLRFGKNYRMDLKDGQGTQNCAWKIKGREASSLVA